MPTISFTDTISVIALTTTAGNVVAGVVDLPNMPTAELVSLPATWQASRLLGYNAAGDGGTALYKRVASEPTHDGKYRSADRYLPNGSIDNANGGWWELAELVPNIRMFGGVGNNASADGAAALALFTFGHAKGLPCLFPTGDWDLSTIVTPTFTGTLEVIGDGYNKTRIKGRATGAMVRFDGGASLVMRGAFFDTWLYAALLNSNVGGTAYETIDVCQCRFENIAATPVGDSISFPAHGGIEFLRFSDNIVRNGAKGTVAGAGLAIYSNQIHSAIVTGNDIRDIGEDTSTTQRDGITLGGNTVTPRSSLIISGNRIENVRTGATSPGGGTGHVSGITAFGRSTVVTDNTILDVGSPNTSNLDQYAIYTKASYSTIRGNVAIDAGGNASCIMTKGNPNAPPGDLSAVDINNVISDNVILLTADSVTRASGIATTGIITYNSGMDIHDNIIEGVVSGVVQIYPVYAAVDKILIHHNKIQNLLGTAAMTVAGVVVQNPSNVMVERNEITGIGTGVETNAYGIWMNNANSAGSFSNLGLVGNTIRSVSASTGSSSRGMAISFNAAGTYTDIDISDNYVTDAGRGIFINFPASGTDPGVVAGMRLSRNRLRSCSVSTFAFTGTVPTDTDIYGNEIDGKRYTSPASGSATPSAAFLDCMRVSNAAPTTITNITGGHGTQELEVQISGANTTIQNNANIVLAGAANWNPTNGGIVTLRRVENVWRESSRAAW